VSDELWPKYPILACLIHRCMFLTEKCLNDHKELFEE